MISPWLFSICGIDIIGKVSPKYSLGHDFILVAINYFTTWVENVSYSVLKAKHVAKFIENNIIYRYGASFELTAHFEAYVMELLAKYKITHHK